MTTAARPSGPGLGARAARGALITYTGQGAKILVQVLSVVILARLLNPDDYGLLAMVLAVVGVGEIFRDFGLSSAAIQAKNLSDQQRTNLFWINTGIGVVLATIVFLAAGLLATLYGRTELIPIAHVLCLTFIMNGLATQFRADLNRRLQFLRLAIADITAPVIGLATGVVTATAGWHYWALVAQQLTQSFVLLVVLAIGARWKPGLPRRGADMGGLLRFGWRLVATQLIGYVSNNVDSVIIGSRFGATQLGIYNRSFQLLTSPLNQLRAPTTTVSLPILARLNDDQPRYSRFIVRGQLALGYSLVAGLGILVGAPEPITGLLLGDQWLSTAPIIRLLAVGGIFQTLSYVGYWVYLSRGLMSDLFRYSLVTASIKVTCIAVGSIWGVVGVAGGYALAPAIAWPISLIWLSRRTVIPTAALITGALRILAVTVIIAVGAAVASHLSAELGTVPQVIIAVGSGVVLYVITALSIPALRRDASSIIEIAKLIPNRKKSVA